jgi:adenylosuccinate lyase
VPASDLAQIKKKAKFNVDRINELEKTLHHDVVAFTRNVSESLGKEKK